MPLINFLRVLPVLLALIFTTVASTASPDRASSEPVATAEVIFATPDSTPDALDPLPTESTGESIVGRGLPFLLVLRVTGLAPSAVAGADDVFLATDVDLGDPAKGGIAAGQNIVPFMTPARAGGTVTFTLANDAMLTPSGTRATFSGGGRSDARARIGRSVRSLLYDGVVSLRRDIMQIFSHHCWPCHDEFGHLEHLELTRLGVFKTAVGKRSHQTPETSCTRLRIERYHAERSYLVRKIEGLQDGYCAYGGGSRMPAFGPNLSLGQIGMIRRWITQGCPDN